MSADASGPGRTPTQSTHLSATWLFLDPAEAVRCVVCVLVCLRLDYPSMCWCVCSIVDVQPSVVCGVNIWSINARRAKEEGSRRGPPGRTRRRRPTGRRTNCAAPQPHTATSEAAPHRRAAPSRNPTLPSPPPASPPPAFWPAFWPALPTHASPRPETDVPAAQTAWKQMCRPPQG